MSQTWLTGVCPRVCNNDNLTLNSALRGAGLMPNHTNVQPLSPCGGEFVLPEAGVAYVCGLDRDCVFLHVCVLAAEDKKQ